MLNRLPTSLQPAPANIKFFVGMAAVAKKKPLNPSRVCESIS